MEDFKKLSDYNVKKESNLILVKWINTKEPDPEYGTFYTVNIMSLFYILIFHYILGYSQENLLF